MAGISGNTPNWKRTTRCILGAFCIVTSSISTSPMASAWVSGDPQISVAQFAEPGSGYNYGRAVAVDAAGNSYTTGSFEGPVDFDPGAGVSTLSNVGGKDIYLVKLNPNGDFVWAKHFGGSDNESGYSVGVDATGNIAVVGTFHGTVDFDPGAGTRYLTSPSILGSDAFVLKLDSNGNFLWAKHFGGTSYDTATSVSFDSAGNVIAIGTFHGTVDFDPGAGTAEMSSSGDVSTFVLKLDSLGNFVWIKKVNGTGTVLGNSIDIDSMDNVVIGGFLNGIADFDPGIGVVNYASTGDFDAFVLKVSRDGAYVWSKFLGGEGDDRAFSLALDHSDNAVVTGYFYDSVDFNPGAGNTNLVSAGGSDLFILKLNSSGEFIWVKQIGNNGREEGFSIAVGPGDQISLTGSYTKGSPVRSLDFDPSIGVRTFTYAGFRDVFVLGLSGNGDFLWAHQFGGTRDDEGLAIAIDSFGNTFVAGYFRDTIDFDSSSAVRNLTTLSSASAFLVKLNQSGSTAPTSTYTGGFTFENGNPTRVTGCAATCNGMNIAIPSSNGAATVTSIKEGAFTNKALTGLSLPPTITSIGSYSFAHNQLTTLSIPDSVTTIGWQAFDGNLLSSLNLGASVATIDNTAFANNQLTSISLPNSLTTLGSTAFSGNLLTSVVIPSSITTIKSQAFLENRLTSISLPNSVTTIESGAFYGNQLSSVSIPPSVESIGEGAFGGNLLTTLSLPNSVTSVGNYAFARNSLTTLILSSSLTAISNSAFADNQLSSVTIGSSVTSIGTEAFARNVLTSVTLGGSVASIANYAFAGNLLSNLILPNSVQIVGVSSFSDNALTQISFGNGLQRINSYAFYGNRLSSISLPSSVSMIEDFAFANNRLESLTFPAAIAYLGSNVLRGNSILFLEFLGNRPSFSSWGTNLSTLQCVYYSAGRVGWPGTSLNGLTPAVRSGCSVNYPTTTTSSTSSSSTSTVPPPYVSTTIPSTPTQSIPTNTQNAALNIGISKSISGKSIAAYAKIAVLSTSKVSLKVLSTAAKICRVSGTSLRGLKAGSCKVTVTVKPKKGKVVSKTITLKVAK